MVDIDQCTDCHIGAGIPVSNAIQEQIMPYKTILVHLNNDKRARSLVEAGVVLGQVFQAHLIGLHVFPAYRFYPPVPVSFAEELEKRIAATREADRERIQKVFEAGTAGQPVVAEWRSIAAKHRDAASVLAEHSMASDLVIASQADADWDLTDVLDIADELALGAGVPVLVLPLGYSLTKIPRVITVAWNGRRESVRALHDAMPLLCLAERVDLLVVGEKPQVEGAVPDTEIAGCLARHGVKVEVCRVPEGGLSTVGEVIREFAVGQQSELIVMGCYGHSRLREFAFGGVTRHLLRDMTLPVMFSH